MAVGYSTKTCFSNGIKWILDSGATDHMTGDQNLIRNYQPIHENHFFTVANNEKLKIKGWGLVSLFQKVVLQDVFFLLKIAMSIYCQLASLLEN
jgi:hypothetical protein